MEYGVVVVDVVTIVFIITLFQDVCVKGEKNERLHENDIVNWMKKRRVQHKNLEYIMSKDEYKKIQEIDEVMSQNIDDKHGVKANIQPNIFENSVRVNRIDRLNTKRSLHRSTITENYDARSGLFKLNSSRRPLPSINDSKNVNVS